MYVEKSISTGNGIEPPIATLPVALSANGLPLGVMLCGRPGSDAALMADALKVAWAIEAPRIWHKYPFSSV